jgi:hypothetical protein
MIDMPPRMTPVGFQLNKTLMGPGFGYIRWRLAIDGTLSSSGAAAGWASFAIFAGTQGAKHVRMRTELELAEKLQQTLAPPLAARNAGHEIHGWSRPSSQMGGDLLDAVEDPCAGPAVYVADVAGHGIQAGVFMGWSRGASGLALLKVGPLAGLLGDLNRVVFEVKTTPVTYVTFACLRCGESGKVEYSLAGSGPILHYCAQFKTTTPLEMEQFPLGLFGNSKFQSRVVEIQPGDILALLTDGLPEATNASDEQFGFDRMGEIIAGHPDAPLPVFIFPSAPISCCAELGSTMPNHTTRNVDFRMCAQNQDPFVIRSYHNGTAKPPKVQLQPVDCGLITCR